MRREHMFISGRRNPLNVLMNQEVQIFTGRHNVHHRFGYSRYSASSKFSVTVVTRAEAG
jgi:hypothetical protein